MDEFFMNLDIVNHTDELSFSEENWERMLHRRVNPSGHGVTNTPLINKMKDSSDNETHKEKAFDIEDELSTDDKIDIKDETSDSEEQCTQRDELSKQISELLEKWEKASSIHESSINESSSDESSIDDEIDLKVETSDPEGYRTLNEKLSELYLVENQHRSSFETDCRTYYPRGNVKREIEGKDESLDLEKKDTRDEKLTTNILGLTEDQESENKVTDNPLHKDVKESLSIEEFRDRFAQFEKKFPEKGIYFRSFFEYLKKKMEGLSVGEICDKLNDFEKLEISGLFENLKSNSDRYESPIAMLLKRNDDTDTKKGSSTDDEIDNKDLEEQCMSRDDLLEEISELDQNQLNNLLKEVVKPHYPPKDSFRKENHRRKKSVKRKTEVKSKRLDLKKKLTLREEVLKLIENERLSVESQREKYDRCVRSKLQRRLSFP